jgi:hypothetical protein
VFGFDGGFTVIVGKQLVLNCIADPDKLFLVFREIRLALWDIRSRPFLHRWAVCKHKALLKP